MQLSLDFKFGRYRPDTHPAFKLLPLTHLPLRLKNQNNGLYGLKKNGVIVYVGRSQNVSNRIAWHRWEGKDFDSVCFLPLPLKMEALYILVFKPCLNRQVPSFNRHY